MVSHLVIYVSAGKIRRPPCARKPGVEVGVRVLPRRLQLQADPDRQSFPRPRHQVPFAQGDQMCL
jgi:hypothetical protein